MINCKLIIEEVMYKIYDIMPTGFTPIRSAIISALMSVTEVIAPLREKIIIIAHKSRND